MSLDRTTATESIVSGSDRLEVVRTPHGLSARVTGRDSAEPVAELPLRFATLRAGSAEPVRVYPAWAPGEPETNFARFQTDVADTYDAFEAGMPEQRSLSSVESDGESAIVATSSDGSLQVRIEPARIGFSVSWSFTVPSDGVWSVVFDPFSGLADDEVSAILAGPFLTERRLPVIRGVLPEGWTAAPFTLVESGNGATTTFLAIPPAFPAWDWGIEQLARYGLGARGEDAQIRQVVIAPLLGNPGSNATAGDVLSFRVLIGTRAEGWWPAWRALAFDLYGLRSYRQNVDGSMTDAVLNMVDLLKDDLHSGWMERGRGFLNLEHRDGVKLASPGAVISAALMTGDRDLMLRRAQPIVEYSMSRSHYGFTWSPGSRTVGDDHVRQAFDDIGGPAWDPPVLVALHELTRGYTPALAERAMEQAGGISDFYIRRSDFQVSLSLFALGGDQSYLDYACEQADRYIASRIDVLDREPVEGQRFLIHIGPDWLSLLDLWEVTREQRFLDAAERGARWMAVQMWLGPVPGPDVANLSRQTPPPEATADRIRMFDRHMFDNEDGPSSWMRDLVDYPRTIDDIAEETVLAWQPSPIGMSFEAWCTYWGRLVMNPGWAPYFLRLATATGDDLYRILAENATVGRFTNYPGYYQYLPTVVQGKPDFPYQGPMDLTSIYYHHIPAQLGIAIDYLISEMQDRSGGQIGFPTARDDSYVQFRHHLPGFAPGTFFDIDDAWPWLPSGLVTIDTHAFDWLAAIDSEGRRFGLALANSSDSAIDASVAVDLARLGVAATGNARVSILNADGEGVADHELTENPLAVTVPARGLVAVRIDNVNVDEPWHSVPPLTSGAESAWITLADDGDFPGAIRAAIVGFEPDIQSAYVFSTAMPDRVASLDVEWSQSDRQDTVTVDRFPFEASIPITASSITLRAIVTEVDGTRHETRSFELVRVGGART